jgi:hypothetical protein
MDEHMEVFMRKTWWVIAILALCLITSLAGCSAGSSIAGAVYYPGAVANVVGSKSVSFSGEPLEGVTVSLMKGSTEVDSQDTASDGVFVFTGVKDGTYTLAVSYETGWYGYVWDETNQDWIESSSTSDDGIITSPDLVVSGGGVYNVDFEYNYAP